MGDRLSLQYSFFVHVSLLSVGSKCHRAWVS